MKTLFHGTTLKNWENIKVNGFYPENKTWYCSGDREIYFYDLDKSPYDEKRDIIYDCINQAFSSAQIHASVNNYNSTELIVLELQVPENFCEDDFSCENMDNIATCVNIDDLDLSMIKKIHICKNGYLPSLRIFYIGGMIKRNNYQINTNNFLDIELDIIKEIEIPFIEEIFNFEYETEIVEFETLETL